MQKPVEFAHGIGEKPGPGKGNQGACEKYGKGEQYGGLPRAAVVGGEDGRLIESDGEAKR